MKIGQRLAKRTIDGAIKDPVLRRKVTPDYTMGCKRVLISNDYYPALARDNVDVVTDGVKEVRAHSVVDADGRRARGRRDHLRHRLPRHRRLRRPGDRRP